MNSNFLASIPVLFILAGCVSAPDASAPVTYTLPGGTDTVDSGPNGEVTPKPRPVATQVVCPSGASHTCALLSDANVVCWGLNGNGQLGLGDLQSRGDTDPNFATRVGLWDSTRKVMTLGGAWNSVCALLDDFSLHCWGQNLGGELGLGDAVDRGGRAADMNDAVLAIDVGGAKIAQLVSGGCYHVCAISTAGRIYCWGLNGGGQLGLGDANNRGDRPQQLGAQLPAVDLGTGRTVKTAAAGCAHTCAVLDNGAVKCWGSSSHYELGLGDNVPRGTTAASMGDGLPAVSLGTGRTAVALAAGYSHTCVLLDNGAVKCWGAGSLGQLGVGDGNTRGGMAADMGDNLPAVDFGSTARVTALSCGTYTSCVSLDSGEVRCWGLGVSGHPSGATPESMGANTPKYSLGAGRTATSVSVAYSHTCALRDDKSVVCWGANDLGQLGIGDTYRRANPSLPVRF